LPEIKDPQQLEVALLRLGNIPPSVETALPEHETVH